MRQEHTELFEREGEYKLGEVLDSRVGVKIYAKRAGRKEVPILNRMWRQTELVPHPRFDTPCLLWTSSIGKHGYASVWYHGKYVRIHRMAMLLDGEILTQGMTIDHLCERKHCWNTLHLEEVTSAVNKQREIARRQGGDVQCVS